MDPLFLLRRFDTFDLLPHKYDALVFLYDYWVSVMLLLCLIGYVVYGVLWFAWIRYTNTEGLHFNIATAYDLEIKPRDEIDIPIKAIYLYPIRGVKGMEVSSVQITPHGLVGDRHWVIVNAKTKKTIQNENSHRITLIRLVMKDKHFTELTVKLQDDKCIPELKGDQREITISYKRERKPEDYYEGGFNDMK